jgi:hypothetical protein
MSFLHRIFSRESRKRSSSDTPAAEATPPVLPASPGAAPSSSQPETFCFTCASCGAGYGIERRKLGARGIRIHCAQCRAGITVRADMPTATVPSMAVEQVSGKMTSVRPSFDQCLSWLRVLMSTPTRPSTDTAKEPWDFAPTCSLEAVREFEKKHGIDLPPDYVRFVTEVGNGTASGGPFAVFPLGMSEKDDGQGPLIPFRPSVPDALSRPFQHGLAIWAGGDFEDEIREYTEENGEPPPTFDAEIVPGALPIANEGCGEWCYLAVSGAEAGTVWEWANGGMGPVPTQWLRPVNFTEWILGEVARQRGLIGEFRQLTGVTPPPGRTQAE